MKRLVSWRVMPCDRPEIFGLVISDELDAL
jgi:hypothetical protein